MLGINVRNKKNYNALVESRVVLNWIPSVLNSANKYYICNSTKRLVEMKMQFIQLGR